MNDKAWTSQELVNYLKRFREEQRDHILNTVLQNDLLRAFMDSLSGKFVINSVIDGISSNITNILNLAIEPPEKVREEIMKNALQINIAYDFIRRLAVIAEEGRAHEEAMTK